MNGEHWTPILTTIALLLGLLVYGMQIGREVQPPVAHAAVATPDELEAKSVCHNRGFAWAVHKNADGNVNEVDCIFPVAYLPKP